MKFLVMLCIFIHYCYIHGTELKLYNYNQEDSETQCHDGLINKKDMIVFRCEVTNYENKSFTDVNFEVIKKHEDAYKNFITINLEKECTNDGSTSCYKQQNFSLITIQQNASTDFDQAILRAVLQSQSQSNVIISNEYNYPSITETTDTELIFYVNDKIITNFSDDCTLMQYKNEDIYIRFICRSKVSPCLIEVKINEKAAATFEDFGVISLKNKFDTTNQVNVKARYAACRLDDIVNHVDCTFVKELENQGITLTILIIILATTNVLIITLFLFIRRRRRRGRLNKGRSTKKVPNTMPNADVEEPLTSNFLEFSCKDNDGNFLRIGQIKLQLLEQYNERVRTTSEG